MTLPALVRNTIGELVTVRIPAFGRWLGTASVAFAWHAERVSNSTFSDPGRSISGDPKATLPRAGWYSDPADSQGQRYWDGGNWTVQTRQNPINDAAVGQTQQEPAQTLNMSVTGITQNEHH